MNLASMNRYKYMINQNTGQHSQSEEMCCCEGQKKCICFEWHLVFWWKSEREDLFLCCVCAVENVEQVSAKWVVQRRFHHLNAKLKPLHFLQFSMKNACFRGLHTQHVSHPLEKTVTVSQMQTDPQWQSLWITVILMPPDLEKHQGRLVFFEFPCHSHKPPTVRVPPGLHKAVWTNVTYSTRWHPSSSSLQWSQINRSRTRKQLVLDWLNPTCLSVILWGFHWRSPACEAKTCQI